MHHLFHRIMLWYSVVLDVCKIICIISSLHFLQNVYLCHNQTQKSWYCLTTNLFLELLLQSFSQAFKVMFLLYLSVELTILHFVCILITVQKHYENHQVPITVSNMIPQSRNINMENCQNNRLRLCGISYSVNLFCLEFGFAYKIGFR